MNKKDSLTTDVKPLVDEATPLWQAEKASGLEGSLFAISVVIEGMRVSDIRNKYKYPFYGLTVDIENNKVEEWIQEERYKEATNQIIRDIKKMGFGYFRSLEAKIKKEALEFKKYAVLSLQSISKLNDYELVDAYNVFVWNYIYYFGLGMLTFIFEGVISENLGLSISQKYANAAEIIGVLLKSDYHSFMIDSENFLKKIKNQRNSKARKDLIDIYIKEYFYTDTTYYYSPILNVGLVEEKLSKISDHPTPTIELDLNKVKLSEDEKIIVELLKIAEVLRDQRKLINLIGGFVMFRFLDQVVKRKKIARDLADNIFWYEFTDLMLNTDTFLPSLRKRKNASMVCVDGVFYFDRIAIKQTKITSIRSDVLKGTPASRGQAEGKVKIVLGQKDFVKFNQGEILVSQMTRPDYLPVMKKAAAIVTDEGGLTCHAAIMARELGIPCVVGTKIATEILKDGQIVKVDAQKGTVTIL